MLRKLDAIKCKLVFWFIGYCKLNYANKRAKIAFSDLAIVYRLICSRNNEARASLKLRREMR